MKIYFAYRTAYKSNLRYLKEFNSNSIYDWFIENWDSLCSDKYSEILGTDVYGFPINIDAKEIVVEKRPFFSKLFDRKDETEDMDNSSSLKPKDFQDLLNLLQEGLYLNEIEGEEDYIKVGTDNDEIGLCWYIFTEEYKNKNEDKVAIWFNDILPTSFGLHGIVLEEDINVLEVKGSGEGCTYFISVPIYDRFNIEDMTVVTIEGVRMNTLLDFLKANELEELDDVLYAVDELNYIKYIAAQLETNDLQTVLKIFADHPITELQEIEIDEHKLSEIIKMKLDNIPEKNRVIINEHSAELSVSTLGEYYNYYLIIDDLWIEKNETLAKSIMCFT
ncbi:hypothetical protein [Kordia sp.]|uniref:hypothetical protein n=1 Tax=Kordia sp. TaxID=1965332 RepID=UPI003D2CFD87